MIKIDINELKLQLKILIIEECDKEMEPEDIKNNVTLFSEESGLELDSLDALQISVALQQEFGIRITDSKDFRRYVSTIDELANYIKNQ